MLELNDKRVLVTGGTGFLGKHVENELRSQNITNIYCPSSRNYDLRVFDEVDDLIASYKPDVIIHLAARVGGIGANQQFPGTFFRDNLIMGFNLIEAAKNYNIQKFVHVGTICSFPKYTNVPFVEDDLYNGEPEPTNRPYGEAKKVLGVMLDAYQKEFGLRSAYVIPTNLVGEFDNFDENTSHVIPALIKKILEAKDQNKNSIEVWGTGNASRSFLYAGDAAKGIIEAAKLIDIPVPINLGTDEEILIKDLVSLLCKLLDYNGEIIYNTSKPDGQPRRLVSYKRANELLKWKPTINLEESLIKTIGWYKNAR